jgi:hypothetical protein
MKMKICEIGICGLAQRNNFADLRFADFIKRSSGTDTDMYHTYIPLKKAHVIFVLQRNL